MKNLYIHFSLALLAVHVNAQVGIGTVSPNSTLDVRGSTSATYRSFSAATSLTTNDHTVVFNGTTATTVTLPDATTCTGRTYCIKNFSATLPTPLLTIGTVSSQKIDGVASWLLDEPDETVTVISDGANWEVFDQSTPVSASASAGGSWNEGGNNVSAIKSLGTISAYDLPFITNNTEKMRITSAGSVGIGSTVFSANPEALLVFQNSATSFNVIGGKGNLNNYLQLNIQNKNSGASASSDLVATADNGNETINYVDLGINSSGNSPGTVFGGPDLAYLYSNGNDFAIGNSVAAKNLLFFTGGTANANERMRINGNGNVGIGITNPANPLVTKDTLEIRRTGTIAELLFTNTSGSGDFRIGSDGTDIFWQGGGGRNLQMGAYWGVVLAGDRQTTGFPALQAGVLGTGVLAKAQRDASVPLGVQSNSATQSANLTEWRNSSGTTLSAMDKNGNLGLGNSAPNSTLSISGSISINARIVSGAYTIAVTDYAVINTGAAAAWTLPAANTCTGRIYSLINQGSGAITLSLPVTEDNATTVTNLPNSAGTNNFQIISDGTVWRKIN